MTLNREIALSADSMDAYVSLFGMNDQNIALIEQECSVSVALRGSKLTIQGEEDRLDLAEQVIRTLFSMIQHHEYVDRVRIRYVIAMILEGKGEQIEESLKSVIAITHRGKQITCKTLGQQTYVNTIRQNMLTFAIGRPAPGKLTLQWRLPSWHSKTRKRNGLSLHVRQSKPGRSSVSCRAT